MSWRAIFELPRYVAKKKTKKKGNQQIWQTYHMTSEQYSEKAVLITIMVLFVIFVNLYRSFEPKISFCFPDRKSYEFGTSASKWRQDLELRGKIPVINELQVTLDKTVSQMTNE